MVRLAWLRVRACVMLWIEDSGLRIGIVGGLGDSCCGVSLGLYTVRGSELHLGSGVGWEFKGLRLGVL